VSQRHLVENMERNVAQTALHALGRPQETRHVRRESAELAVHGVLSHVMEVCITGKEKAELDHDRLAYQAHPQHTGTQQSVHNPTISDA
jgi:hypothetical protein